MNEELERQVENAVGDLRAFAWRKRRIREELLTHLLAIHDEEIARGAASDAATATAIARWGDTRELARALQRSVPMLERIAMRPLPALDGLDWTKKASESTARFAARWAVMVTATTAVAGMLPVIGIVLTAPRPWLAVTIFGAVLVALLAASCLVMAVFDLVGLSPRSELAPMRKGAVVGCYSVASAGAFLALFFAELIVLPGVRLHDFARVAASLPLWAIACAPVLLFVGPFAAVSLGSRDVPDRLRC